MPHEIARRYRFVYSYEQYLSSLFLSVVLFIASVGVNTWAGVYATLSASNPVTDLILSNIPVYDVDIPFVYGSVFFIFFVLVLGLSNPKYFPFTFSSLALFYLIRAVFVTLTHLAPFPIHTELDFQSKFILLFWGGGDEFFSGHTGAPFLLALMFWHREYLRYIFLACSIFFAVIVLLGHIHYSIDVISAFFITYGIYQIAKWLFPKQHLIFMS